jgi:hypothetical protein
MQTRVIAIACVVMVMSGCSIKRVVEPLAGGEVSEVCILDNPRIHMDGFQPELQNQISGKGYRTSIYQSQRPAHCSHFLEYTANWKWDMAMYLAYADLRVFDRTGLAGKATYDARSGGGRLDKFGGTAEKIRPLVDQLFASTRPGAVPIVNTPSAAESTSTSKAERLNELGLLREQDLITHDEYLSKRQQILDEI